MIARTLLASVSAFVLLTSAAQAQQPDASTQPAAAEEAGASGMATPGAIQDAEEIKEGDSK